MEQADRAAALRVHRELKTTLEAKAARLREQLTEIETALQGIALAEQFCESAETPKPAED